MALLLLGAYLFALGLSNLMLLPVALALASLTSAQAVSQVAVWQQLYISQLMFGLISLAGSAFVAFFKFSRTNSPSQLSAPQLSIRQVSKPAELSTEELISELKLRMPSRT